MRLSAIVFVLVFVAAACGRIGFDAFEGTADGRPGELDATGIDAPSSTDAASGSPCAGSCACPPGESCSFTCVTEPCSLTCEAGSECDLTCAGCGFCDVACNDGAFCRIACGTPLGCFGSSGVPADLSCGSDCSCTTDIRGPSDGGPGDP